jgi:hypothetical protein
MCRYLRADPWPSASFWRVVLYWDHERVSDGMAPSRARVSFVRSPSGTATGKHAWTSVVGLPVTGDTA